MTILDIPLSAKRQALQPGVLFQNSRICSPCSESLTLKSDNGPPFSSKEFRNFAEEFNFHHRKIIPLWPQANGGVERFMKTLKKALRCISAGGQPWKEHLAAFLLSYRATPHSTTAVPPATALLNRAIRTQLPELPVPKRQDQQLRSRDAEQKKKIKQYADKRAQHRSFRVGDRVLLRKDSVRNKLDSHYQTEPYCVTAAKESMITARRGNHTVTRNAAFFKKFDGASRNVPENDEHDEYERPSARPDPVTEREPPYPQEEDVRPERPQRHRRPPARLRDDVTAFNAAPVHAHRLSVLLCLTYLTSIVCHLLCSDNTVCLR